MLQIESISGIIMFCGGGRWARILIEAALFALPKHINIHICSPSNAINMQEWVNDNSFSERISVDKFPYSGDKKIIGVIVVNAVKDHFESVKWALNNKLHVLVEKPLTLGLNKTIKLCELARSNNVILSPALIFRHFNSLCNYLSYIGNSFIINSVYINWCDAVNETRYGEKKKFDHSLPIFADIVPHIFTIINELGISNKPKLNEFNFFKGGALVDLNFIYGDVFCKARLERMGSKRQRRIEIITNSTKIILDFSDDVIEIYPEIAFKNFVEIETPVIRPSIQMLSNFYDRIIDYDKLKESSQALTMDIAYFSDQIFIKYLLAQRKFIIELPDNTDVNTNQDLKYSLIEFLSLSNALSISEDQQKIFKLLLDGDNEVSFLDIKSYFLSTSDSYFRNLIDNINY